MNAPKRQEATPTPIRLPDELKTWLKHAAVDNRRSLNAEMLVRLEESRRQQEQPSQGAKP